MPTTDDRVDPLVKEQSRIKAKLLEAGVTLAEIDRSYQLSNGTARNTMREPNARGERAIAAALGTRPHLLWPTRYRATGQRRSPQNWTRVPTLEQRRNEQAA
jgi:Ner family transcriptional regulator